MQPTVLSLFCGAGGFDLGFKQAGYRIVGAYDFDKFAIKSYRAHIGDHAHLADVRDLEGADLPDADVWTYGFPCQDLSKAGPKAGLFEGTKSRMFFEVMRLLAEVRNKPRVILAENVNGIVRYLDVLREEYDRAGYHMIFTTYDSKYFGVPQSRSRYFILGVRKDLSKTFVFPEVTGDVPTLWTVLETTVDDRFYMKDDMVESILSDAARLMGIGPTGGLIRLGDAEGMSKGNDARRRVYSPQGISPTLDTCGGGGRQPKILVPVRGGYRVRRLTPREYMRLQGFPDSFDMVVSMSQVYKQMGNAVTVPVARHIAESIHGQILK